MTMRAFVLIAAATTLCTSLLGCVDPAATESLKTDTERLRARVAEAKAERLKYGDASALYALVSVRLASDELTLSMLEQKLAASRWYPKFTYTVDGQAWKPPADAEVQMRVLEEELKKSQTEAEEAKLKALSQGGLLRVISLVTAEIKAIPVAQLEYQILALKHGFPINSLPKVPVPTPGK